MNFPCIQKKQMCYMVLFHIHHVHCCCMTHLDPSFFSLLLDPRYVLLPPQCPSESIPQSVENKIAIHFATCFGQNVNTVHQYLKQKNISQWAQVQRLAGGDLMYALELFNQAEDCWDATYVWVHLNLWDIYFWFNFNWIFLEYDPLVDCNAHLCWAAPDWEEKPFYGQLKHILVIKLPPAPDLDPKDESLHTKMTYLLTCIHACNVDKRNSLGMPIYSKMGAMEVSSLHFPMYSGNSGNSRWIPGKFQVDSGFQSVSFL